MNQHSTPPTRAIIICAYTLDRWEQLAAAVDSVRRQVEDSDEIIVVIDHNEELLERSRDWFDETISVVANAGRQGLSGARNTGVSTATAELVLFLDDDARASEKWLSTLTGPFENRKVVGAGGAALPDWANGSAPGWMPDEFLWVVGCSYEGLPTTETEIRNPIGCNMAFRRQAILDAGGFSSDLGRIGAKPVGGEETDLAIRVTGLTGGTVVYVPDAVVHHSVAADRHRLDYFMRRCYFEGRSKAVLAGRVGADDATSAERAYLTTLWRGASHRAAKAVKDRDAQPIAQVAAIGAGLAATGTGFALGTIGRWIGKLRE